MVNIRERRKLTTVNLLDPDVEPSDEDIDELLASVSEKASNRAKKAHAIIMKELRHMVRKSTKQMKDK